MAGRGLEGKAVEARLRRRVKSRRGEAVTASPVGAGPGRKARPGVLSQGSQGAAVKARQSRLGDAGQGLAWRGKAVMARLG